MSGSENVTLPPQMPDAWVQQVAKVVHQKLWPSILSAVMAALIGWGASFFTARMMIDANLKLEQTKADLQLEQDRMRARTAAYSKLATSLDSLHQAYAAYLRLVPTASRKLLSDQALEVGRAVRTVEAAKSDPILLKSVISEDVDACLNKLNQVIINAQREPNSALSHQNVDSRLIDSRVEELAYKAQQEGQQVSILAH
jgi:hypothetical protein